MAKGVRSKAYRMHRTEFRRTVGQVAADKAFDITQARLDAIVGNGVGADSLSKASKQLGGDSDMEDEWDDIDEKKEAEEEEKKRALVELKIEPKKGQELHGVKKHARKAVAGQPGSHRARIIVSKSNKRGQTKKGFSVAKKSQKVKRDSK